MIADGWWLTTDIAIYSTNMFITHDDDISCTWNDWLSRRNVLIARSDMLIQIFFFRYNPMKSWCRWLAVLYGYGLLLIIHAQKIMTSKSVGDYISYLCFFFSFELLQWRKLVIGKNIIIWNEFVTLLHYYYEACRHGHGQFIDVKAGSFLTIDKVTIPCSEVQR